jgi:VIT1/CCC1 family predicted Fe2+/Mn2+ transporter
MRAQKELLEYEINVERTSLRNFPREERAELLDMFLAQGIDPEVADRLSKDLMSDPDLALRTHAREELGIDPSATGSPWRAAGSSLISFAIGAFIPLAPWVFTTSGDPVLWSIILAAIGLFIVGGVIGWFTRNGIIRWGLRQLLIGGVAALVTFLIGRAVGAT